MTQTDLSARIIALLTELNPDAALWDGLDDAIIGIALRGPKPVAVYDYDLMVAAFLRNDGWTRDDAVEWIEFNVVGAYVGTSTPFHVHNDDTWGDGEDDDNDGGTFFDAVDE